MQHVRAWLAFFVVLWFGWMMLVGEWNHIEWIAATCAAAVAATVAELARSAAEVHPSVPLRVLGRGWSAFLQVFADFGIVMWALVRSALRREVVRGSFRTHWSDMTGDDAAAVGTRVWLSLLADYSPNAYVVDVDPETGLVLLHDLVPRRASEQPA